MAAPRTISVMGDEMDNFFNQESVRRKVLKLIQMYPSFRLCPEHLEPENHVRHWLNKILPELNILDRIYQNSLPELELACDLQPTNQNNANIQPYVPNVPRNTAFQNLGTIPFINGGSRKHKKTKSRRTRK